MLFSSIINSMREQQITEWVLIEVLGKKALPTPCAMQALLDSYQKAKTMGCKRISVVSFNDLQEQLLVDVAKLANIEISFYSSEQVALSKNKDFL